MSAKNIIEDRRKTLKRLSYSTCVALYVKAFQMEPVGPINFKKDYIVESMYDQYLLDKSARGE